MRCSRWFSLTLIIVVSITIFFSSRSTIFADGTYTAIGTTSGNDGSDDAINFSQGRVWTIDKYGKYIWTVQQRSGPTTWTWSNDQGTTWVQGSENYSFLTRSSVAYDSKNDVLHVIWTSTNATDGIIYRRYNITRDGSNNITDILRMDSGTVNLQLDTSTTATLSQGVALWVDDGSTNGTVVATWSKEGGGITEVRTSMRTLSMTASDGVAGNWLSPDGSPDTFAIDPPNVSSDAVYANASSSEVESSAIIRGGTGTKKDDLYVFFASNATNEISVRSATWNSGSGDWSGGWQGQINLGQLNNTSGYNLKQQLLTKPVIDTTNDRLYVGWAWWKDNTVGDTVSFAYLDSTDTPSSVFDVYSANGTHSYAPTFDIAFDNTQHLLYAMYVESTTNGDNGSTNYLTFDGTTLSSPTRFYTSPGGSAGADGGVDIPILYEQRSSNDRLLVGFRVNGALPPTGGDPHIVYWGYIDLPTPTPTPTPSSGGGSSSSSSSSNSNNKNENLSICGQMKPLDPAPSFQTTKVEGSNAITLYFTDAQDPFDSYSLAYGLSSGQYQFGADHVVPKGAHSYTVRQLSPNTTYYFRIRGANGCASGSWSKEIVAKTKLANSSPLGHVSETIQKIVQPIACVPSYIVQRGDSLWRLAERYLGSGFRFRDLIPVDDPVSKNPSTLPVGKQLTIPCGQ